MCRNDVTASRITLTCRRKKGHHPLRFILSRRECLPSPPHQSSENKRGSPGSPCRPLLSLISLGADPSALAEWLREFCLTSCLKNLLDGTGKQQRVGSRVFLRELTRRRVGSQNKRRADFCQPARRSHNFRFGSSIMNPGDRGLSHWNSLKSHC